MTFFDMHMHTGSGEAFRELITWLHTDPPYRAVPSATSSREAKVLFDTVESDPRLQQHLFPAAGLHPWNAGLGEPELRRIESYLLKGPWIGEIGLDRPWCDVPLEKQLTVFRTQLELGARHCRPVLIHSKGYEEQVLYELRDYPHPVIIHWYSCQDPELLERFIAQRFYFTLGPDNGDVADTEALWRTVPLDRVLLETDGLEAIRWAEDTQAEEETQYDLEKRSASHLLISLEERLTRFAEKRQLDPAAAGRIIAANSKRFINS